MDNYHIEQSNKRRLTVENIGQIIGIILGVGLSIWFFVWLSQEIPIFDNPIQIEARNHGFMEDQRISNNCFKSPYFGVECFLTNTPKEKFDSCVVSQQYNGHDKTDAQRICKFFTGVKP